MSDKDKIGESEVTPQTGTQDAINGNLASLLETLEDLTDELGPRLKLISQEYGPSLNEIKANLDREETFVLMEKLTANTDALLELVTLLEATTDLAHEMEPRLKGMMAEMSPFLTRVKTSIDRDETMLLIEKLAANTGTFIDMLSMLEALRDLVGQFDSVKSGFMKDLAPKMNIIRMYIDDEEFWGLMNHMFVLKKEFAKLFEDLVVEDEHGNVSTPLVTTSVGMLREAMIVADNPAFRNMITATAKAVSETKKSDIKPMSIFGAISAMRGSEVRRAIGFFVYLLRQIGKNL
ncbi:MAG: DUF1641 domain-containing protein [Rubrobacteridae bacterium]|nr:DUF1641 domain-containing protein [Rubrobacteridae bacterium]